MNENGSKIGAQRKSKAGIADETEQLVEEALRLQHLRGDDAAATFLLKHRLNTRTIARVLLEPSKRRGKLRRGNSESK